MRKVLRFLLWLALIVGGVLAIARAFAIRFFWVPDDLVTAASVQPSLEGGDLVILWRLTKPVYGDLVVCPEPDRPDDYVIGRLLAEEGDEIEVKGDNVIVNGKKGESEMACAGFVTIDPDTEAEVEQRCNIEVLGGRKFTTGQASRNRNVPGPVRDELMEGEVYLVSDNRLYPYDSRVYGALPRETCPETVVFRLVSARGWADAERRLSYIR